VPPASSTLLRFSTDVLPERDRFAAFREEFARRILRIDLIDRSEGHAKLNVSYLQLGPAAVGGLDGTAAEAIRDVRHVKDGAGDFLLLYKINGSLHVGHAGQEFAVAAGTMALLANDRPQHIVAPVGGRLRTLTVAPEALRGLVANADDAVAQPLRGLGAQNLVGSYLTTLASLDAAPAPELAARIGQHLVDLLAAAIGPTREGSEIIEQRGLKAARRAAVLALIAERCCDPAFDLDSVARELAISRRYIQLLLEDTGTSFVGHLATQRLLRARAMLSDPRYARMRVIDIALAVGFGDVSHFNRTFRRTFGETPSDVRAAVSGA
jgi:AraC-like DNA-binding protein